MNCAPAPSICSPAVTSAAGKTGLAPARSHHTSTSVPARVVGLSRSRPLHRIPRSLSLSRLRAHDKIGARVCVSYARAVCFPRAASGAAAMLLYSAARLVLSSCSTAAQLAAGHSHRRKTERARSSQQQLLSVRRAPIRERASVADSVPVKKTPVLPRALPKKAVCGSRVRPCLPRVCKMAMCEPVVPA